jgi:hypothetical protein
VPPGPYAVIVSNAPRVGSTYDVILIDVLGHIVARVTARLPLLKPNQTLQLPLVSASGDLAYYLDGDTTIRSLSPSGASAPVKTIPDGSSSIIAFAVSPDDQRIAVSLIKQGSDLAHNTGRGYVEGLTDGANRVNLFNNTAQDAFRWPVGWLWRAGCRRRRHSMQRLLFWQQWQQRSARLIPCDQQFDGVPNSHRLRVAVSTTHQRELQRQRQRHACGCRNRVHGERVLLRNQQHTSPFRREASRRGLVWARGHIPDR